MPDDRFEVAAVGEYVILSVLGEKIVLLPKTASWLSTKLYGAAVEAGQKRQKQPISKRKSQKGTK